MDTASDIAGRFHSIRLGLSLADLKPGQVAVSCSARRTWAERGYDYLRPLWIIESGGRAVISVHPAAAAEVSRLAWGLPPAQVMEDTFCDQAAAALRTALSGVPPGGLEHDVTLYHPANARPIPIDAEIRPLCPADMGRWASARLNMWAPQHPSAQRGEAFGVAIGDKVIAWLVTHDPAVTQMAHLIAEDAIETAEEYRGRGYGKALLAFWTCEMQAKGRVCLHSASIDNAASLALARSVGYVEYAHSRFLLYRSTPPQSQSHQE
jgi:GNAT superfamily N-acetyltransferase